FRHSNRFTMKSNIVQPEYMRPCHNTKSIHDGGPQLPFTLCAAKNRADESLARGPEQYGALHARKGIKVSYYVEIVRNCLAKTQARINYYLAALYSVLGGKP